MKKIILVASLLILAVQTKAQVILDTNALNIPPLENLIEWALQKSPILKEQKSIIERDNQILKLAEKKWMDKVFTDVGYTMSNNFAVTSVDASNSQGIQSLANSSGDNYRAGVTVRIGLYDVFARKNLKKQEVYRVEASRFRAEIIADEIRLKTTMLYKNLQLTQRLLLIKSRKKQTLAVQLKMSEKEFLQGEITTADLGRITELTSNADADFETAVIEYEKAYLELEQFVGQKLK